MSKSQSGYALKRSQSKQAVSVAEGRAIETRNIIVVAARDVLLKNGYAATRVEDIIKRAEISRPTFYRHFKDKFEVAKAYHAMSSGQAFGPWSVLGEIDFHDVHAIEEWLEQLLASYADKRDELVVWAEMSSVEPDYMLRVPRQMPDVIAKLGEAIPAFARAQREAPPNDGAGEPGAVWVEAYLLLEQLSYNCTWITLGTHPLPRRLLVASVARRTLQFIEQYDEGLTVTLDGSPECMNS